MKSETDPKEGHRDEQMESSPRHGAYHDAGANGEKDLLYQVKVDHVCVIDTLFPHLSRRNKSP